MASKKNKKKNLSNNTVNNIEKKVIIDNDTEECEKILERLDEIEKKQNMSSKVKSLIKEDKEAIRKMNENIKKIEEDELDYLDDEVDVDIENDEDNKNSIAEDKVEEKEDLSKKPESKDDDSEKSDAEASDDSREEEANLDFFANLNREDNISNERIRKKAPKRLANDANKLSFMDKLKLAARNNTKNFAIGTAIAFLFIVLVIALAVDAGNKDKNDDVNAATKLSGEFIEVDTTPFIDVINNYYAALESGDINVVRSLIADSDDITDDEIKTKCDEAKAYAELVGSSFMVTDCYIQKGMKDKEYIVYYKFQVTIKSIKTPTVGLFTSYIVDEAAEASKVDYKVCVGVNDKSGDIYKYILKMSSCKNVTDIFNKVDKELEEACEKDSDLKAIVDVLKGTDSDEDTVNEETTEPMKDSETKSSDKKDESKETTKSAS
mgnify:FL=1